MARPDMGEVMDWLKTSEERQADYVLENPAHPIAKALMFMGGERTLTGRSMNDGRALSLPAVYNAVSLVAGDLATVPLKVYAKTDNGGKVEETGHPLSELLTISPSPEVTSEAWREHSQGHVLLRGNMYTEIVRNTRGMVVELKMHHPDDVMRLEVEGRSMYKIVSEKRILSAGEMLHVAGPGGNGKDGWSVIKLARESFALYSALEESNARMVANADRPSGILRTDNPLKPETLEAVKKQWKAKNSGLSNIGGTPVLDGGLEWQQVGLTAEDAQYLASRRASVTDVARWFNVPPHKLKDLERATFSNISEQEIDYVRGSLRPWARRWRAQMLLKLFTPAERARGLFAEHNLDGIQQGDPAGRSEAQRTWLEIGTMTPNEIRAQENRPAVVGGDRPLVRMDMTFLDRLDDVQSVETDPDGRTIIHFAEKRDRERVKEFRAPDRRIELRAAAIGPITDAAGRMVRGEIRNVRRILKRHGTSTELRTKIEEYYFDEHPDFVSRTMSPQFQSYAAGVATAAFAEVDSDARADTEGFVRMYVDSFAAGYSKNSRRKLQKLEADDIELRLDAWSDGEGDTAPRHVQVANRQVVELGDAVARNAWIAAGITALIWRTVGDNCPYCARLNGKRVDSRTAFILKGEAFEGEGTEVPLVPKSSIHHAPAHRGCNCTIVPGII